MRHAGTLRFDALAQQDGVLILSLGERYEG